MTIQQALQYQHDKLALVCTAAFLDAELLLAHVLGKSREYCLAHGEERLTNKQEEEFCALIERRINGEPIAYLTSNKEFYGRDFHVDSKVLIPRPETEMMIDVVKQTIDANYFGTQKSLKLIDIGTGSGCIAVILKKEISELEITATDISEQALMVANDNAKQHKAEITFLESDLFTKINSGKKYDIIVSNPPYVEQHTLGLNTAETNGLSFEPRIALTPENGDDFQVIDTLLEQVVSRINKPGLIVIEIGYNHGNRALTKSQSLFNAANVYIQKDLAGLDRFLIIKI